MKAGIPAPGGVGPRWLHTAEPNPDQQVCGMRVHVRVLPPHWFISSIQPCVNTNDNARVLASQVLLLAQLAIATALLPICVTEHDQLLPSSYYCRQY